jgi:hypothetical protein
MHSNLDKYSAKHSKDRCGKFADCFARHFSSKKFRVFP